MQQCDQPRPGLVLDAAFPRDPRADRAGRARQGFRDPGFQSVLLLHRQPAATPFMAEARQAFDPVLLIELAPAPDCVAVEQQYFGDRLTATPARWRGGPGGARRNRRG